MKLPRQTMSMALAGVVGVLALLSCDLSALTPEGTDTGGSADNSQCTPGAYKCSSPTLRNNPTCFKASNFSSDAVYVCVKPDGTLANAVTAMLEELSDYTNRNNITCVSKLKCTRI